MKMLAQPKDAASHPARTSDASGRPAPKPTAGAAYPPPCEAHRALPALIAASPRVTAQARFVDEIARSPRMVAQRQALRLSRGGGSERFC